MELYDYAIDILMCAYDDQCVGICPAVPRKLVKLHY